ncbi:adhesion G protein-coupled receptor L4 [Polypterus senegalus]|uniref:adhesion G protein-coupled receptor L4 n=1 Tax=Polypterus senegalus TaxID=55291 RepID=UPI001966C938|nr:adhesion G protein-coupled receptor L4 [Polypterus senegalus]
MKGQDMQGETGKALRKWAAAQREARRLARLTSPILGMESVARFPTKFVIMAACFSSLMAPYRAAALCNACHMNATCTNYNGSEGCYCKAGFTGDGNTFCQDDDECVNATQICGEFANCTNTVGSYYCTCKPGFKSTGKMDFVPNDGTQCQDIDECEISEFCGLNAKCQNTKGSFICSCMKGFVSSTGVQIFHPRDHINCTENPKKYCHLNQTCVQLTINRTIEQMGSIKNPQLLLQEITNLTSGDVTPVEMISYVEVLSQSASSLSALNEKEPDKEAQTDTTIKAFVKTVNSLVEKKELSVWQEIDKESRKRSATKLLHTVEQAALGIAKNFKKTTQTEVNESDMALKIYVFNSHQEKHIQPCLNVGGDFIEIFPKESKTSNSNGNVAIVFVRYTSMDSILMLPNDPEDTKDFHSGPLDDYTIGSQIVAAAFTAHPEQAFSFDHVTFSLKHSKPSSPDSVTQCAFWNYLSNLTKGHWSTEGCKRTFTNGTHTGCRCTHLTHFAILMSSGRADMTAHYSVLTRITQLGIIISLICLSMCIFTFCFFSEIQSTRITIHKNLCCSLFLAEFIFLVGINMNTNKLLCSVVAGLLHYFFLAAFAWMCVEGIHLYLIVVGVIYNKGFLHRNFYIFGYGSPAVVVGISAFLGYKYYGTSKVCWLSTENNFIWSFIGPACLIILVNLLAFGVIIYKVFHHTAVKKPEVSCYENIVSCARGALALLFLLGATWTFGVLHVVYESEVTAYFFTIFNAFQGMFIFIFLCVLSRKIQDEYYRLFKNVPCCFQCLR